jgi:hypothetical protein
VFHGENAAVVAAPAAHRIDIRFRLPIHSRSGPEGVDVLLVLEDNQLRAPGSGAPVATARRKDLDLPFSVGR